MVFEDEVIVLSHAVGIRRLSAHLRGLAALLQQSQWGSRPGSLGKDERLLHQKEHRHPVSSPGVSLNSVERGKVPYSPEKKRTIC